VNKIIYSMYSLTLKQNKQEEAGLDLNEIFRIQNITRAVAETIKVAVSLSFNKEKRGKTVRCLP
jgi:hypothetical protein